MGKMQRYKCTRNKKRTIVVKFLNFKGKQRILHTYKEKKRERRRKVEKEKISINNDFFEETARIRISVPQVAKVLDSKTK